MYNPNTHLDMYFDWFCSLDDLGLWLNLGCQGFDFGSLLLKIEAIYMLPLSVQA